MKTNFEKYSPRGEKNNNKNNEQHVALALAVYITGNCDLSAPFSLRQNNKEVSLTPDFRFGIREGRYCRTQKKHT